MCLVWSGLLFVEKENMEWECLRQARVSLVHMIPPNSTRSNWWQLSVKSQLRFTVFPCCVLSSGLRSILSALTGPTPALLIFLGLFWLSADDYGDDPYCSFFITMDWPLALDWIDQTAWDWNRCLYSSWTLWVRNEWCGGGGRGTLCSTDLAHTKCLLVFPK